MVGFPPPVKNIKKHQKNEKTTKPNKTSNGSISIQKPPVKPPLRWPLPFFVALPPAKSRSRQTSLESVWGLEAETGHDGGTKNGEDGEATDVLEGLGKVKKMGKNRKTVEKYGNMVKQV